MADSKQLDILKQGLQVWNKWRRDHSVLRVDLSHADLKGFDLSLLPVLRELYSRGVIPSGSSWAFIANEMVGYKVEPLNLRNADLRGANLNGVGLRCADCSGSDISGASISGAELAE